MTAESALRDTPADRQLLSEWRLIQWTEPFMACRLDLCSHRHRSATDAPARDRWPEEFIREAASETSPRVDAGLALPRAASLIVPTDSSSEHGRATGRTPRRSAGAATT